MTAGLNRRQLVKAGALVGGTVWVAPVISSFGSSASAASLPAGAHQAIGSFCFDAGGLNNRPVTFNVQKSPSGAVTGSLTYGPDPAGNFYVAPITCAIFTGNTVTIGGTAMTAPFTGNTLIAVAVAGGNGVGVYHGSFGNGNDCTTDTPNAADGSVIHNCPAGPVGTPAFITVQ